MTWQQIALTAGVALFTAISAGWFQRPKVRGDGEKASSEGAEAMARAQNITLTNARDQLKEAQRTCSECRREVNELRTATEALVDAVEQLLDRPDDIGTRQTVRLAIRAYRTL